VPRRIFGCKRQKMAAGWRKMHNEELHNLHSSPYIIWVIKSRRMRWDMHVARMGEMKMHTIFWLENLKGKDHAENLGTEGRIILT
jgi:hypothetical protein